MVNTPASPVKKNRYILQRKQQLHIYMGVQRIYVYKETVLQQSVVCCQCYNCTIKQNINHNNIQGDASYFQGH